MELTDRVRRWRDRGEREHFRGHGIHVFRRETDGPMLVMLHGFPSSSYDFAPLLEELAERRDLAQRLLQVVRGDVRELLEVRVGALKALEQDEAVDRDGSLPGQGFEVATP